MYWLMLVASIWSGGGAAHYRPGLMEEVSRNRGMEPVAHMCSSPFLGADMLGSWIRVRSELTGWEFDCRITDVSANEHRQGQIDNLAWLELDWDTAQEACLISKVGERRPRECPVTFWIPQIEAEAEFPSWRYEHQVLGNEDLSPKGCMVQKISCI